MKDSTIHLSGVWALRAADGKETVPCPIPGDNYSALQDAGLIPDPYWRDNETKVQWVADKDWVFSRQFDVASEMLRRKAVFISFDCIDTVAEVIVNGHRAGSADNQFRRWRFEVGRLLREKGNKLEVRITSPRRAAVEAVAAAKSPIAPVNQNDGSVLGLNFLRKCQCSAGWDWGVSIPASGLYGDVSLVASDDVLLDSAWTAQTHAKGVCRVEATVRLIPVPGVAPGTPVSATISFGDESRVVKGAVPASPAPFELRTVFRIANPDIWWPNGYGGQPLYQFSVEVSGQRIERKVGLRRLEVVTTPDRNGSRFVIRVNGVEVFAKGADWIPCDARPRHETSGRMRDLLESAVAANMNALRVWGGGHFESDFFYEECDRLGLLLWHDMMFACMIYPSHRKFLENVRAEIGYQVRRLRDHACIALWCGDNECVGAVRWHASDEAGQRCNLAHYAILNDAVGEAVREADPTRLFWPSSPSGGPGNFSYNDGNSGRGDTHFWSVWFGGARFSDYCAHRPRFCSEFGFQSFPSIETVRSFASEGDGDFNLFGPVMDIHQKCPAGNSNILGMFGNYFRMPKGFAETLYLSQVQQSIAIGTGVELWRSLRPYCMGTIFWQLNDNWPTASWSSLEYGGRWKALHHAARRFYAPLAAFAYRKGGGDAPLEAHLVWDLPLALKATVKLELRRIADGSVVKTQTLRESLAGAASRTLALPSEVSAPLPNRTARGIHAKGVSPFAPEEHFLVLRTEGRAADGRVFRHSATVFLDAWKRCDLPVSGLAVDTVAPVKDEPGCFDITLLSKAPAFFGWLAVADDPRGRLSDNLVTVLPDAPLSVRYRPGARMSAADLRRRLSLMDLRNSY